MAGNRGPYPFLGGNGDMRDYFPVPSAARDAAPEDAYCWVCFAAGFDADLDRIGARGLAQGGGDELHRQAEAGGAKQAPTCRRSIGP